MLYEFHRRETSQKPGSVHATYLVSGTQIVVDSPPENGVKDEGEGKDVYMQSSPYMSSPMPTQEEEEEVQRQKVITLVREEHLKGYLHTVVLEVLDIYVNALSIALKDRYEEILSIHVYSLQPGSIQVIPHCHNVLAGELTSGLEYGNTIQQHTTDTEHLCSRGSASSQ